MANPVWVLSVDLQAKTATFTTGMAEAAKSARGAFTDIQTGANKAGKETGFSMMEARHAVRMLGDEFGIRMPRALAGFIAGLGPMGPALEAAFPFLAIIALTVLLVEHLKTLREEGAKLTADQINFQTAVQNAFNTLDDKLIQAQIKADELRNDHLGALHHQLELIDHQSMAELVKSFGDVAKAADIVFKDLEGHWYSLGKDSAGAKHALDEFQRVYDNLLAKGDEKGASGLLHGTLTQAQQVLDLLKTAGQKTTGWSTPETDAQNARAFAAQEKLKQMGIETGASVQKQLESQQALVDALEAQVGIETRVAALKKLEDSNATGQVHKEVAKDAEAEHKKLVDLAIGLQRNIDKVEEEARRNRIARIQQEDKESIEVTERGSQERLAAIDAAIKNEESHGLRATDFYRSLLLQRIQVLREMGQEEAAQQAEFGRIQADHDAKMAEIKLQAIHTAIALQNSVRRVTWAQQIQEERAHADAEFLIQQQQIQKRIAALDKGEKDYQNKLMQLQNKELELRAQHEADVTAIKQRAETQQNQHTQAALEQLRSITAEGLTSVLMGHQKFGQMVMSIGDQVLSSMLTNAIKEAMLLDFAKEKQAAKAARTMFLEGLKLPFPANIIVAPVLAAGAFAAVMAFQGGTDAVPGSGRGDIVPAMLEPGEGVVPKGVMEGLRKVASSGGLDGARKSITVHMSPTYHVQTIDGDGMQAALDKHTDALTRKFQSVARSYNN